MLVRCMWRDVWVCGVVSMCESCVRCWRGICGEMCGCVDVCRGVSMCGACVRCWRGICGEMCGCGCNCVEV